MSRFVRPSKYRHVYGEKSKRTYENAKISGSAWDTDLVSAGGKYLAVNWQVSGGGAFAILPAFSPFNAPEPAGFPLKLPDILPLARGHTAPVLDTAWSPFHDDLVVSGGEDGKICVWKIEDSLFEGWGEDHWQPEDLSAKSKLNAGGRKVGQVIFHPTASHVLASASGDHLIRLWDIENGQDASITLKGHGDSIQSLCWNTVGTTLATTCRDKKLRLFDPRAGTDAVRVADGHSGVKGSRVVWLGDRDRIATTGFSRMSDRQVGLWNTSDLSNIEMNSLDSSAGVLMPFFAEGNDVLFLAGKGDGNIRYYEYEGDSLHSLNEYKSSEPQRGMTFLPRRALDVGQNEIARAFKLAGGGIEPLSFIVPRKAESFQSDIFPPANSIEPALSASDFFAGKTARPKVIDLETRAVSTSEGPIPSAPSGTATPSAAPSLPPSETAKSKSAPADYAPPTKEEPKPTPKQLEPEPVPVPSPAPAPVEREPDVQAKSLEIEQPESDDETPIRTPPKEEPAPALQAAPEASSNETVTALVLEKIVMAPILEVEDLEATARGEGGFGSTGGFGKKA
ncbi:Coronin-like protein [Saitozyma sp. JCM 24511]|nr:Coronin-like protein [Saitozyma sp. JCM 24511]